MSDIERERQLLKSRKTEDRIRAIQRLATRSGLDTVELLMGALDDPSSYVARLAADGLSQVATWEIGERLTEKFKQLAVDRTGRDPGCFIRTSIAFALGKCEYGPAAEVLIDGIRTIQIEQLGQEKFDMACQLRAACAMALAEVRAPNAIAEITPLLFDTGENRVDRHAHAVKANPDVRSIAAKALARLGDRAGLIPLSLKLLFSDDEREPDVIVDCMNSAAELGGESALRYIKPYLHHDSTSYAAAAALAIASMRAEDAHKDILIAIDRVSNNPLKACLLALTTLRTPDSEAALLSLKRHSRSDVRVALIEILADRDDAESRTALSGMAKNDSSLKVREQAAAALRPI